MRQVAIFGGGVAALLVCACLSYRLSRWSARRKTANRPEMTIVTQTRVARSSPLEPASDAQSQYSADTDLHGIELREEAADVYAGSVSQHDAPPQPTSAHEEEDASLRAALAASIEDVPSRSRETEDLELAHALSLSLASEAPALEPTLTSDQQPVVAVHVHEATVPPLTPQPLGTHLPTTSPHTVMGVAVPQPHSLPPLAPSMPPPPVSSRFCANCGTQIKVGSRFCGRCGTRTMVPDVPRSVEIVGRSSTLVEDTSPRTGDAVPPPNMEASRTNGDGASSSHTYGDAQPGGTAATAAAVTRNQGALASGSQSDYKTVKTETADNSTSSAATSLVQYL